MNIDILHMIEGARQARGIAVIIDVFRAFTVEAMLVAKGAGPIIPVADEKTAYRLKEEHPHYILVGERRCIKLPGFDFGNSPSEIQFADLTGKTVVHTTSAGTQGLEHARRADEVLTGSLVNAAAIAAYIQQKQPDQVSLVCMGLDAVAQTEEDNLCAKWIQAKLEGWDHQIDLFAEIKTLQQTSGAKFFNPQKPDFPESDFWFSTTPDRYNFILRRHLRPDGLFQMNKIPI